MAKVEHYLQEDEATETLSLDQTSESEDTQNLPRESADYVHVPSSTEKVKIPKWAKITAPIAAVAALGGIFVALSSNKESSSSPKPQASAQPHNPNQTGKNEVIQFPEKVEMPNSTYPQELIDQLYNNYELAINTGDEGYLQFVFTDTNTDLLNQARLDMQRAAAYRDDNPGYHYKYKPTLQGTPSISPDETSKKLEIFLSEKGLYGTDGPYNNYPEIKQSLTLGSLVRIDPDGNEVVVWLISDIESTS